MTPRRPYMLRAFYEWLVDNELTPHLVVEATLPGVRVPEEFIQDGQIILNVAPRAVGQLELGNEAVTFSARFGGRPHSVIVPLYAIEAIYARENGAGTMFEPEEAYMTALEEGIEEGPFETQPAVSPLSVATTTELESVETETEVESAPEPVRPKGKPSLRVIK
ncbi:ClpXP protease specificity-enhancing factor [Vibrio makurazakiensis]